MFGRRLAERLNVALRVVTVVEPPQMYGAPPGLGMTPLSSAFDFTPIQEEIVKRSLREAGVGERCTLDIRHGEPTREIRLLAEEVNATFIIVAAAPHRRLRHDVAGIFASQVLRNAPCPVLSLSMDAARLTKTIVAGIDFSPSSIRSAQAALLVLDDSGTLILAHAPAPPPAQHVSGTSSARYVADVADAFSRLRDELRACTQPTITIETAHLEGRVAPALLGLAEFVGADMVTVGSHSRNMVERFFVGSVASTILHAASCSVLASPPPPPAHLPG
jgi:nucleotide-binding universal stress UspA family protein